MVFTTADSDLLCSFEPFVDDSGDNVSFKKELLFRSFNYIRGFTLHIFLKSVDCVSLLQCGADSFLVSGVAWVDKALFLS